jgi:hypothetical protein
MTRSRPAQNEGCSNSHLRQCRALAHFAAVPGVLSLFIAAFAIAASSPAYAKPMSTSFQDAIAASDAIAIVRLVELPPSVDGNARPRPKATLDVLQVLKGNLRLGKQQVGFEDYPEGGPGEFIAFLDKNRVWRFTARPSPGKKVDSDVLGMEGFYDTNMHFVFPGVITLEQLKTYLKDGTLRYSIEGPIWFPQRHRPAWMASTLRIKLTYDLFKNKVRVTGLPKLAGFPAEPTVWIQYDGREKEIHLDYSRRSPNCPLELLGWVESLDPISGSLLARFVMKAPDALSAETLEKYLADERLGHCYYKFRLHCARSPQYPEFKDLVLTVGEACSDCATLDGWGGRSLPIIESVYAGPGYHQGGVTGEIPADVQKAFAEDWVLRLLPQRKGDQYLMLAFDVGKPKNGPDVIGWTFNNQYDHLDSYIGPPRVLYNLHSAPARGTLQLFDGKSWNRVTTFTVDLEPVQFGTSP